MGELSAKILKELWYSSEFHGMFSDGRNNDLRLFYCDNLNQKGFEILRLPSINYMDIQRYVYYGVGESEPFTLPDVPKPDLDKYKSFDLKRTVIINTKSTSMDIDDGIFLGIVDLLKRCHMDVYTNISGNQKALAGTRPLSCNLEELYYLVKKIRFMVSIRSGILDFLQSNEANYVVLYNDETEWDAKFRKAYDMAAWKSKSNIYQYNARETDAIYQRIETLCE